MKNITGKYITLADYTGEDIIKRQAPISPEVLFGDSEIQPYTGSETTIIIERIRSAFGELLVDKRVAEHILSLVNEGLSKQKALFNDRKETIAEMQEYVKVKEAELLALDKKIEQASGYLLFKRGLNYFLIISIIISVIVFIINTIRL